MAADTAQARLYDLIDERRVPVDAGIPRAETLKDASDALGAVGEFLTNNIRAAVAHVSNRGEPHSITYEDIGRLVVWADHIRDQAQAIVEDAAVVAVLAHGSFDVAEGYYGDPVGFSDFGRPKDSEWFKQQAREAGFRVASDV